MNYDTLDYLIPPVLKRCEDDEFKEEHNITGDVRRLKPLSTNLANYNTPFLQNLQTYIRTYSPLLQEQFSDLNYMTKKVAKNNFNTKGKNQRFPILNSNVIKITVVPIKTETSTIVFKRNELVKIHKTTSNTITNLLSSPRHCQENHGIKKTSSADLFKPTWKRNRKYDEITFNRMTHTKSIINSLNMNHKGRQGRVNQGSHEIQLSPRNTRKSYKAVKEKCVCNSPKINNVLDDMNSRNNRVTIFGRLGINENDQYILNCAATVNNKPIETYTSQQNLSYTPIDEFENCGINKITKATQADINLCFANNESKNTNINHKNVQCYCRNAKDVATNICECKFNESAESKSPLIVISVYPTKDTAKDIKEVGDLIQINRLIESKQKDRNPSMNSKTIDQKIGGTSDQKTIPTRSSEKRSLSPLFKTLNKEKVENRTPRDRSPSPPNKNVNSNIVENRSLRSNSRSPPIKTHDRDKSKNRLIHHTSQKSFRSPERQNHQPSVNKFQKDRPNRNTLTVNAAQTSKLNPFKNSHGGLKDTIAKKNKIKKAIVDSYTQRVLMPKGKDTLAKVYATPRSNASSVTINIDGDNENYRVLFLQDKLSTDLCIRKTMKTCKQKPLNDLIDNKKSYEDLMKNIRVTPKKTMPVNNLKNLPKKLNNSQHRDNGGLKIRDSLEMRYWRENGEDYQKKRNAHKDYEPTIKIMPKNINKNANNEDFSVPVKHYRGDQCCVPNPIVRDQEIRDLLGIKKPRSEKSRLVQEALPEFIGHKLHYILYREKCMRSNSVMSHQYYNNFTDTRNKINTSDEPKCAQAWTQCEKSTTNSYKQMVLNRNIQVFLQVEQFSKHKPIMLSRKQYEKVKKTIKKKASKKISQKWRRINSSTKSSVVLIGKIRKARKQSSNEKICRTVQADQSTIHKQKDESIEKYNHENNKTLQTVDNSRKSDEHLNACSRQVVSSTEVCYASLTHLRHVTFSSTSVNDKPQLCLNENNCPSVQTIFKGHKKCVTPNLGTSAYSLDSDEELSVSDNKYNSYLYDKKPKKPFLRRLMSCLVMRSNRASEAILPQQYKQPSLMNSFDSYHINTSLGAVELTSSLYDTSASFYSNHTVLPIARMKRGFLSSVRGFLTNLKSR